MTGEILFKEEQAGAFKLGFVALNSPRSLNALDLGMLRALGEKLLEWRGREEVACVVLHAESEKAFSAGGDVKALALLLRERADPAPAREFFTTEYFADYLIHVYPKPILCWADGITMGGGIGIMNGASYRAVTERTVMAMPEISIGLFPDVGATYFFNRLPPGLGLFLGLTGARFDGFDAVAAGMAEGVIRSEKKGQIFAGLARLDWTSDPRKNRRILSDYLSVETENDPAARSDLAQRLKNVRRLVDKPGIDEIDRAFRSWTGTDAWMKHAIEGYLGGSPTSARAIFEQLRRGRELGLKEAFLHEWDMALNFCRRDDFREGVRARLIDKDQQPRWNPARLADVEEQEIERLFSSDPGRPNALAEKIRAAQIEER